MELILHIGAHRTGSTMVERTVRATLAARPELPVTLWTPQHMRDLPGMDVAMSKGAEFGAPADPEASAKLKILADRLARDIRAERVQGTKRLIISEENFLGAMRRNFMDGAFYGDVVRRLTCLNAVLPDAPDYVALGVREYGAAWISAYYYLAEKGKSLPPQQRAGRGVMAETRGWPDVVADALSVWPQAGLYLWPQESLGDTLRGIAATLMGIAPADVFVPEGQINARQNQGPQQELFDVGQTEELARRYKDHMHQMRAEFGAAWLDGEAA